MERAVVDRWFRSYGPSVLRRSRALLRNEDAARDALQEVFLRVVRAESEFRQEASPTTWLYRATTNYCLNLMRDSRRRQQLLAEQPAKVEGMESRVQNQLHLVQVLQKVPSDLQEIAVYHYVDQMSHDEIAEMLGLSRRTVGNRLEAFRVAAASGESHG